MVFCKAYQPFILFFVVVFWMFKYFYKKKEHLKKNLVREKKMCSRTKRSTLTKHHIHFKTNRFICNANPIMRVCIVLFLSIFFITTHKPNKEHLNISTSHVKRHHGTTGCAKTVLSICLHWKMWCYQMNHITLGF